VSWEEKVREKALPVLLRTIAVVDEWKGYVEDICSAGEKGESSIFVKRRD